MRVHLCAVGPPARRPGKKTLSTITWRGFDRSGRALGLTLGEVAEVEDRKGGGMTTEAELIRRAVPRGATLWVLGRARGADDLARLRRQAGRGARRGDGGDLAILHRGCRRARIRPSGPRPRLAISFLGGWSGRTWLLGAPWIAARREPRCIDASTDPLPAGPITQRMTRDRRFRDVLVEPSLATKSPRNSGTEPRFHTRFRGLDVGRVVGRKRFAGPGKAR